MPVELVPDQPAVVRAALVLADYALELRAAGRRCEMADKVFDETPEGMTRSMTIPLLLERTYQEMLLKFDELATAYIEAKLDSIKEARS